MRERDGRGGEHPERETEDGSGVCLQRLPDRCLRLGVKGYDQPTWPTGGQPLGAAPAALLVQVGPGVQVTLSVAQTMAAPLVQQGIQGIPLPAPESRLAVIDTGASVTCVDDAAAQAAALLPPSLYF